jgi:hypothetical protein
MGDVKGSIEQWRAKQISDARLLRDLVEHETWYLPVASQSVANAQPGGSVSPAIRFARGQNGEKVFCVFSGFDTFNAYQERLASPDGPDAAMEALGTWIFGRQLDEFVWITIDAFSPTELRCDREQYGILNQTAADVRMEQRLAALSDGRLTGEEAHAFISEIKHFENFYVVLSAVNGAYTPAVYQVNGAPFLAVFTGMENARVFYEQMAARFPGSYSHERHSGASIADGVLGSGFQGLVFNPGGSAPVGFAAQLAHLVNQAP